MSKARSHLSDYLFNGFLVAVLFAIVALPQSAPRRWVNDWIERTRAARSSEEHWDALAATRSRIDARSEDPPVIIEFGNYTCAFCRQQQSHIDSLLVEDPSITVGYRHLLPPSATGPGEAAARASICAEFQGRFKAMHALLYRSDDWRQDEEFLSLAAEADVPDLEDFEQCLGGDPVLRRLEEDRALAEALQVSATPTFVYRGGVHIGYLEPNALNELVQSFR